MRYLFLILGLLLALPTQAAGEFVDKRFNIVLSDPYRLPVGRPVYLTPYSVRTTRGSGSVEVYNCELWENKQNFVRYYCPSRYVYDDCKEYISDFGS